MRSVTLLLCLAASALAQPLATVRFKRIPEPREQAFTLLVPDGWRASGGIVRVNPLTAGGPLNSIAAKLDFALTDPTGAVTLRWLPETAYVDLRNTPAGQMGMFPPGSNYNGAMSLPVMSAMAYLQQMVFRRTRPGASGLQVKLRQPLPQTAQSYQQIVRLAGVPLQFRFDAALLIFAYQEGGKAWDECLYTAIQDMGPAAAGLWSNKDTFTLRTPAGQLEKLGPVVSTILNSVQLNPAWVEGEIRGQIQRSEIAIRTQQEIARLDREIVEHRRRTNAEINNQMYHSLMGTEEYVNPHTKKVEVGSNAWNYRWVNGHGEAIYTDDPNYDPVRQGLQGFTRSPIRKRFPQK